MASPPPPPAGGAFAVKESSLSPSMATSGHGHIQDGPAASSRPASGTPWNGKKLSFQASERRPKGEEAMAMSRRAEGLSAQEAL